MSSVNNIKLWDNDDFSFDGGDGEEVGEAEEFGQSESEVSRLCPPLILHASLKLKYVVATS